MSGGFRGRLKRVCSRDTRIQATQSLLLLDQNQIFNFKGGLFNLGIK